MGLSSKISCNALAAVATVLMVSFLLSSCDPAFSPIKENDRTYSVFGYLNASADTQFVRIEYLRDSLATNTPLQLDAEVKLTNIETGQQVTFQDSVFEYYQAGKAHNYYTTMDILPKQSYRLEVKGRGSSSSAEVDIPDSFPEPDLIKGDEFVKVRDIDRLIAVKTIYHTCQNCGGAETCPAEPTIIRDSFSHLKDTVHLSENSIKANYDSSEDLLVVGDDYPSSKTFTIVRSEVVVAAGTPQWPDFLRLDEEAMGLTQTASNIDGGTGLLGGIFTDTLTIETNSAEPCYRSS